MSQWIRYDRTVYLAGQIASSDKNDIYLQTREVTQKIDELLAEAGSDKSRILQCLIFLADRSLFAGMNEVWDAWVTDGMPPVRATLFTGLANPKKLIEIVTVAACAED